MQTNAPEGISRNHLIELAKKTDLVGGYRTAELLDAVEGYARVVLADKAVQEAFVAANQHLLKVGAGETATEIARLRNIEAAAVAAVEDVPWQGDEWYDLMVDLQRALRGEVNVSVAESCRNDGRCQYAIDHGAEGLGHCPPGKCCIPANVVGKRLAEGESA